MNLKSQFENYDKNKIHVIIPSAVLVRDELQNLGKLPAVIYPINQRIVFDYLYEQYKETAESIRVICGNGGEKIHGKLSYYTDFSQVVLEDLPVVKDLGYTVQYGIRNINEPIIINFGDTVVADKALLEIENNYGGSYYYAEDTLSDQWTFFEEFDGQIINVIDKSATINNDMKMHKLFVGVFFIIHTRYFYNCLNYAENILDSDISTFYYALREYSRKYPLKAIKTDQWFDIGHSDKYHRFGLEAKAREFNHISIDKHRGILKKTSDDKEKFIGEIKWYLKLPAEIEYVVPRIFDYSTHYNAPFVTMEYYAYHTLHELYLYSDLSKRQWMDIFERINIVCNDFRRYRVSGDNIREALNDIYLEKTIFRLNLLRTNDKFKNFFNNSILVNGNNYENLECICKLLPEVISEMLYDVSEFTIIHGDLCFTNIMVDDNFSFIKLIDPRGKFGPYDIYGDPRYELAKLFHCVDGKYDFIIKDQFELKYSAENNEIQYNIRDKNRSFDIYPVFLNAFQNEIGEDLKKIELIEALLFLSMIPLHSESFQQQLAMLATGLEILSRVVNIEKEDNNNGRK